MIDAERLDEFSRPELQDLAVIYSGYVLSRADEYEEEVKYRIGLSAFFDIRILHANKNMVATIYKKSPQLENGDILNTKLNTLTNGYLSDLLEQYDQYIIRLDEHSIAGGAPVCLSEFLDSDYSSYKSELLCNRLKAQLDAYTAALIAEGAEAMRNKNKRILDTVERFFEAFCEYDYNAEALEAASALARDNALIPAIVDWAEGRDIYIAVVSNTLGELFDKFCRFIMGGGHQRRSVENPVSDKDKIDSQE